MKSILLASLVLAGTATVSSADPTGTYGETHPRIHEINARLRAQDARIDRALAAGKISSQEAATLHAEDASIKGEERTDISFDKGHITRVDQRALNQQLNDVSRQIGPVSHPRIHEVNARLRAQTARIDHAETAGKITAVEADAFHADDAAIKSEEETEMSLDKGHLTRADERSLNQQVSSVGHQVGAAAGNSGSHAGSHGGSHK